MKNYLLILGIISIFLVGACSQQPEPVPIAPQPAVIEPVEEVTEESEPTVTEEDVTSQEPVQVENPATGQADTVEETVVAPTSGVVEIDMIARQWDWNPATIRVKEGDKVKLNIKNIDVPHGFKLFEFGVSQRLPGGGEVTTVEFTADKAGEYIFFCSVPCGRGHGGMRGKLIVE